MLVYACDLGVELTVFTLSRHMNSGHLKSTDKHDLKVTLY